MPPKKQAQILFTIDSADQFTAKIDPETNRNLMGKFNQILTIYLLQSLTCTSTGVVVAKTWSRTIASSKPTTPITSDPSSSIVALRTTSQKKFLVLSSMDPLLPKPASHFTSTVKRRKKSRVPTTLLCSKQLTGTSLPLMTEHD